MTDPVRTCVGCRRSENKTNLVRVIAVDGTCVVDVQAQLPGRGAYLHLTPDCLELAIRRRALHRALRSQSPVDVEPVQRYFDQANLSA